MGLPAGVNADPAPAIFEQGLLTLRCQGKRAKVKTVKVMAK
jgi:HSP20 family molecular chaperone IbpA